MKPPPFSSIVRAFLRRDWKMAVSYRAQLFFQFAGLFSLSVTFFFLSLMLDEVEGQITSLDRYGGAYFPFALVGIAVSLYIDTSLRSFSASIRQAQMTGTFEAMLSTRTPISPLIAGSAAYSLLLTSVRSVTLILVGVFIFRMRVHPETLVSAVAVYVLTAAATLALGMVSAGFIVLFHKGDPLTMAISGMSWLLSGVLYPKEILPGPVQQLAQLLPMTHSMEAMRLLLLQGRSLSDISGSLFGLALFAAIGIPVSLAWFRWAINRAREAGSLARY